MIKFFRHIRQKLLETGKIAKYFRYAIGEIVLVVIGILIALQVNNWNIKNVNENLEQQILIELKKEYESNLDQLKEKNEIRSNLIMDSAGWLINYIEERNQKKTRDTINYYLSRTLIVPSYDPYISVTKELINSGKLQLIQNIELKTKLTKWPSTTNDLVGEEKQYITFMYESYFKFLLDHYQLKPLVSKLQNDPAIFNILKIKKSRFSLIGQDKKEDIKRLFDNEDFEDYLSLIMGFCNFLNNTSIALIEENEEIIQLIQTEIKNQ